MKQEAFSIAMITGLCLCELAWNGNLSLGQQTPYDNPPEVEAPYYRVRYQASSKPGELTFAVQYTIWIPPDVETLRGVIVHQHGCGEGSCRSGQTGAFDLHWQALARQHHCALLSPSYEQPQSAECQLWCDPRNGSDAAFQRALRDLGEVSDHPELPLVPWALWGHSGGGHWAGGMTLLHPHRVLAVWLRSGVPLLTPNPNRPGSKTYHLPDAALGVPMMCNLGTQEGVSVTEGRFADVWPKNEAFFGEVRKQGGLIGVAVDPLSSHDCGNQRYLAIPWLDACLTARLPGAVGDPLRPMPTEDVHLAQVLGKEAVPAAAFVGNQSQSVWLPNAAMASAWEHYVRDTNVPDETPPPSPNGLTVRGNALQWTTRADLESGIAHFLIERDGKFVAKIPDRPNHRFGRPIFQGLQYSDTPLAPLKHMTYTDTTAQPGKNHCYRVVSVNTVGLRSP